MTSNTSSETPMFLNKLATRHFPTIAAILATAVVAAIPADAQDGDPGRSSGAGRERPPASGDAYVPPAPGTTGTLNRQGVGGRSAKEIIEREDLAPVLSADGSGLPHELWSGMTVAEVEALIGALDLPPRSPALHSLFVRLLAANVPPPTGSGTDAAFAALRAEVLDRAGLLDKAAEAVGAAGDSPGGASPLLRAVAARIALSSGDKDQACGSAREIVATVGELPPRLRGQAILVSAICAVLNNNMEAAGLHRALAAEAGAEVPRGLEVIDLFAAGGKPGLEGTGPVTLLDWRALEIAGAADASSVVAAATPALLAHLARAADVAPADRVQTGEAAAAANAIPTTELAAIYRAVPDAVPAGPGQDPAASLARAALFQAAEAERTPAKKARLIRSFLDQSRKSGLYWQALALMAGPATQVPPIPELGWFAETAIEAALAAGDFPAVRRWTRFGGSLDRPGPDGGAAFAHWEALADIADSTPGTDRSRNLGAVEQLALRGRMDQTSLHRLVTVLDALDVQVPISLWETASRTPQPDSGHLPETGILPKLADASKKKEFGRTVLLAMKTLGPAGAEGAHMIALGDAIRALRRAGLEQDAHTLALEALFASWPRMVTN